MCRGSVNLLAFFRAVLAVVVLAMLVSGCAAPSRSTRANGPSGCVVDMPVALGDTRFVRWAGSSL